MSALIPEILGLGVAMILGSLGILVVAILLLTKGKKGLLHAWAFLLGNVLTLAILLSVGFFLGNAISSNQDPSFQNHVDIVIGLLFIFLGVKAIKWKDRHLDFRSKGHFFWFSIGFLISIINFDSETMFLVGMHEIIQCSTVFLEEILLIVYLCFMILAPVLLPLGIYYAFPTSSEKVLQKIDKPIRKYGAKIVVFILFLFGAIFLLKGFGLPV